MNRKLRIGMVGGGNDAFICAVHRIAAFMYGQVELVVKWTDRLMNIYPTGTPGMSEIAQAINRVPRGHPEGYMEAFTNICRDFARMQMARMNGEEPQPEWLDFPDVKDGIRGMQFIDLVVEAGFNDKMKWVKWPE